MTRDRGIAYDLTVGAAFHLELVLFIAWMATARLFYRLPFTTEAQTRRIFMQPVCWALGHDYADEERYGVEPLCLNCHKRREVSQA